MKPYECESCGRDATTTVIYKDDEPFHLCRRCAEASYFPMTLPYDEPVQRTEPS